MITQYAIKQTAEFSEVLKEVCFGKPEVMKKLRAGMSVVQEDIATDIIGKDLGVIIKAGDLSIFVKSGDEFEAVVKKYAYWHN